MAALAQVESLDVVTAEEGVLAITLTARRVEREAYLAEVEVEQVEETMEMETM